MRLLRRRSIHDVFVVAELLQQLGDLFGRMLEVVVEGDDHVMPREADAAQHCVVLAVVPHQVHAPDPLVIPGEALDHRPRAVAAAVVDDEELVIRRGGVEHRLEPADELGKGQLAVVGGHDRRDAGSRGRHKRNRG